MDGKEQEDVYRRILSPRDMAFLQKCKDLVGNHVNYKTYSQITNIIYKLNHVRYNENSTHRHTSTYLFLRRLELAIVILYILLSIFQQPYWCTQNDKIVILFIIQNSCQNIGNYHIQTTISIYLSNSIYYSMDLMLITFLMLIAFCKKHKIPSKQERTNYYAQLFITVLIYVNNVKILMFGLNQHTNISQLVKPFVLILTIPRIKSSVLNYLSIFKQIRFMIILLSIIMTMFTVLGIILFQDFDNNPIFDNPFFNIMLTSLYLTTTVDSPDIYLPYYQQSSFSLIFFIIYQLLTTIILINILVAVYNSSYSELIDLKAKRILRENPELFDRIIAYSSSSSLIYTPQVQFDRLNYFRQKLYNVMNTFHYEIVVNMLSLFTIFALFQKNISVNIVFIIDWYFVIESCMKIYYHFNQISYHKLTQLNLVINIIIVMISHYQQSYGKGIIEFTKVLEILVVIRATRISMIMGKSEEFIRLLHQISSFLPQFFELFGVIGVFGLFYSALGHILFGGIINESLQNEFKNNGIPSTYDLINFNDNISGLVSSFTLLIVNNWNLICQEFILATGTNYSALFFVCFYVTYTMGVFFLTVAIMIDSLTDKEDVTPLNETQIYIFLNSGYI